MSAWKKFDVKDSATKTTVGRVHYFVSIQNRTNNTRTYHKFTFNRI